MGDLNVRIAKNESSSQDFVRHLLSDVEAINYMLKHGWFEDDIIRIGAEQEFCIIDEHFKPAHENIKLLEHINHEDVVTELAQFNLELNLDPHELKEDCFSTLENEILSKMDMVNQSASDLDLNTILTGILPTIRKSDVDQKNVTPLERYKLLLKVLNKYRGEKVEIKIAGTDELRVQHPTAMMEACNTSFQVHLQIKPDEFVNQYNFAQIIAAPVMALACNSPLLFGRRLWHETRIALFQQSVDTRRRVDHLREKSPRVVFGNQWLKHSVTELYKEDIVRYKVLLNTDIKQDSMDLIREGKVPKLRALNIHNGTIYRWNRPCYGISSNGKPHLRIENRIIPSGPSVIDEVANAAFWIGLMQGHEENVGDLIKRYDFDDAKNNFFAASRYGINSYFKWLDGDRIGATKLIQRLIPIARRGLEKSKVNPNDIDRYLNVIEERVNRKITGASWMLDSFNQIIKNSSREEASTAITAKTVKLQQENLPIHTWDLATIEDIDNWSPHSLKVEEFMTTDLFTAQPSDIVEFLADVMEWRKIRHLPIENVKGKLVGLVSSRGLLKHYRKTSSLPTGEKNYTAEDVMIKDPITIRPTSSIIDAIQIMETNKIGCLPVVERGKMVGIITEVDFLSLSTTLIKRLAKIREK